jgi:hypothetical protein
VQASSLADQSSSVRITGTIRNPNAYDITNVVVCGALLDATGRIVSIGSEYLVQSIAPGATAAFNASVPKDTYASYQLFVQAEGDFR